MVTSCLFPSTGLFGWCPDRGHQMCSLLIRVEIQFRPSSVQFCKLEREECSAQCQVCPTNKLHDLHLSNQKQSFKIWSLKGNCLLHPTLLVLQQGVLSSFGKEEPFSLVLQDPKWCQGCCQGCCHAQSITARTDTDSCLLSPSALQSRQI